MKIYLTCEEKEVFEKKMKLANCKTMSHFLRKCVLEKEIYIALNVGVGDLIKLQRNKGEL